MKLYIYHIKTIIATLIAIMVFSCKNDFEKVQQIGVLENFPITIAENINLKYTDSGKIKVNLLSPKVLDFSNREFPFREFPDGIRLTIYDDNNSKNVIESDYAIVYEETDLIDLQGNVVITTPAKDSLFADQLFYDQEKDWFFSNKPVKFVSPTKIVTGKAYDSNKDFTAYGVTEVTGYVNLEE